jgi:Na+-driven multidrug efflux pump
MVCDGGESVSAAANTTEIVGNVLLSILFTKLWGIKGLAAASVTCKLIFLAIVLIWYLRKSHVRLILFFQFTQFVRMCKNGVVKASTFAFSALMYMILNRMQMV